MTPSKAPSEAQERFEFQSKDGSWQPCRNVRDAAMWAADGWTIRSLPIIDTSISEETKRALAELREHAGRAAIASQDIIVGASQVQP